MKRHAVTRLVYLWLGLFCLTFVLIYRDDFVTSTPPARVDASGFLSESDSFSDTEMNSSVLIDDSKSSREKLFMSLIITSASDDSFQHRSFLRTFSWVGVYRRRCNSEDENFVHLKQICTKMDYQFVIGTRNLSTNSLEKLRAEQQRYGDLMLLEDVQDTYLNLNAKVKSAISKVFESNVAYSAIMKIDDDTWLDIEYIYRYIQELVDHRNSKSMFVAGDLVWKTWVKRNPTAFWYDPDYPLEQYPTYPSGPAYVLSWKVADYLKNMNDQDMLREFRFEDVQIGSWLFPLKIEWIDDSRFSVGFPTRKCQKGREFFAYHIFGQRRTRKMIQSMQARFTRNWEQCRNPCGC
jgi:hypothetical protein